MKPITTIASVAFALIALGHLARLFAHLDVVIAGHAMPMWISVVGSIIAAAMAIGLWREAKA